MEDFAERLKSFESARYDKLRPGQQQVLARYLEHIDDPDIAIELPTGYGKTLVGLLIADSALERGLSVAYLTGTNHLADQVLRQAQGLPDLECVKFSGGHYAPSDLAAYHDAQAVGVMNYWVYFNARPRVSPADVVIFDDAHLAEEPLVDRFALRISRHDQRELYESLCDLVLVHTELYPNIRLFRSGQADIATPPELLTFVDWLKIQERASALIERHLDNDEMRFVWPVVSPHLPVCGMLVGPSAIELRPYLPPTRTLPGYQNARQRVYMSATLGTMDDLQRRLGTRPIVSLAQDPIPDDQTGRRLFLLNPGDDDGFTEGPISFVLEQARHVGRAAWLCGSDEEAKRISEILDQHGYRAYRLLRREEEDVLTRWSSDADGHLIAAGRYDGFDLAGDLCHLVILTGVPVGSTELERFVIAYLGDATYVRRRVGQRIAQALGRANREPGDFALYIGLAPGLSQQLAQPEVKDALPHTVRTLVEAALDRTEGGWSAARETATAFWADADLESPGRLRSGSGRRRPGRSRTPAMGGSAADEVSAVCNLWLGDLREAADAAAKAADSLLVSAQVEHSAFWRYVQAQAIYLLGAPAAPGETIGVLKSVIETGPSTAWFVRLRRLLSELRATAAATGDDQPWETWDQWIREAGYRHVQNVIARCRTQLTGTHDQQAEALEWLGHIVGAAAMRPPGEGKPDAIWTWVNGRHIERRTWEVKTGDADAVPLKWVDQSLGQVAAAGDGDSTVGCILTHLGTVDEVAAPSARTLALLRTDAVVTLADWVSDRLNDYGSRVGTGTATERGQAREFVESRMPTIPWSTWLSHVLAPSNSSVIDRPDMALRLEATS